MNLLLRTARSSLTPPLRGRIAPCLLAAGVALTSLTPALAPAQLSGLNKPAVDEDEMGGFLSGSLLPDGSVLKNVILPKYDSDLRLKATLHAEELTLHTRQRVEGKVIQIHFFNPEQKETGIMALAAAIYDEQQTLVTSDSPVSLVSDRLDATGTGLVFNLNANQGFLKGPITADATLNIDKETAMNPSPSPTRRLLAGGAALMMAAVPTAPAAPAAAAPAPAESARRQYEKMALTEAELQEIATASVSAAAKLTERDEATATMVADAHAASETAQTAMTTFLQAVALGSVLAQPAATEPAPIPPPAVTADAAARAHITAATGAFLDPAAGILVFLKDVTIDDPRFKMTGADEVKAFFDKKPEPAKKSEDAKKPDAPKEGDKKDPKTPKDPNKKEKDSLELSSSSLGDLKRVIATGQLRITRPAAKPGDSPMNAYGRKLIYDPQAGELILMGGSPWLQTNTNVFTVKGEEGYIRYNLQTGLASAHKGTVDADVRTSKDKP